MSNPTNLAIVIMAGGAGTRFWPMSTEKRPKQFLKLFGDRSLLQKSYDRIADLVPPERILILTNESFIPLVKEQLPEIPENNVIGEPMRRDTAAAVALAAYLCKKRFGNPVMAIMTSDHLIEPKEQFQQTLLSAADAASRENVLYTFGIQPTYPATGFGYLECSTELIDDKGIKHYELKQFKEKPDLETAEEYLKTGRFFWNSGMFVWSVETIVKEIEKHLPEHSRLIAKGVDADGTAGWEKALTSAFEPLEKISIDFGIMEKAEKVRTVGSNFSWKDVGGWPAMEEHLESLNNGNVGQGNIQTHNAESNLVFCEDASETVAIVGVNDLVVVRSGDKTLIVHKDKTEEIKKLVEKLDASLK